MLSGARRLRGPVARSFLAAVMLCTVLVAWQQSPGEKQPAAFTQVSQQLHVQVSPALRHVSQNSYAVSVQLQNATDSPATGPVVVVVEATGVDGLSLKSPDGEVNGRGYIRLLAEGEQLDAGGTTQPRKVLFEATKRLSLQERGAFQLKYELVRATAGTENSESADSDDDPAQSPEQQQAIERAMLVQEQWTERLLKRSGVVGTATALDDQGRPVVMIIAEQARLKDIPATIDGVPTMVQVTGRLYARPDSPGVSDGRQKPDSGPEPLPNVGGDPKDRFDRPVPIGVSTGNRNRCSAGTIGCCVRDANGKRFALSNNHVYALQNAASAGDDILQPGRADTNCQINPSDVIARLSDFVPISFTSTNTVDAAIAEVLNNSLDMATPDDGYGTPNPQPANASFYLKVKKYGRTSRLTAGRVIGLNATVNVGYSNGTAQFVNQIIVMGDKSGFIKAGDSGSLLVKQTGNNPVGLLFAGSLGGRFGVANPINAVLSAFNVSVDNGTAAAANTPAESDASKSR